MVRIVLLLLLLPVTTFAQELVPINWETRTAGEIIISSRENPVRLSDSELKARGFTKHADGYWVKPVCDQGSVARPDS